MRVKQQLAQLLELMTAWSPEYALAFPAAHPFLLLHVLLYRMPIM